MNTPLNRNMLLFDIEKFSDRDDVEQGYLRRMLYGIADRILEGAGIDKGMRCREDRGDGLFELIDPNVSVVTLLRAVLTNAPVELRAVNRVTSSSARIRLRAVVATGFVTRDEHGWVGSDLNHAFRLLDAQVLRNALAERPDDFALCVSDGVHHGIVRHDHPGIPAEEFHAVTIASKNGPLGAWLWGEVPASVADQLPPAAHVTPSSPSPDSTARPPTAGGGPVSFGGAQVNGDQIGISGGTVSGDFIIGDAVLRRKPFRGEQP